MFKIHALSLSLTHRHTQYNACYVRMLVKRLHPHMHTQVYPAHPGRSPCPRRTNTHMQQHTHAQSHLHPLPAHTGYPSYPRIFHTHSHNTRSCVCMCVCVYVRVCCCVCVCTCVFWDIQVIRLAREFRSSQPTSAFRNENDAAGRRKGITNFILSIPRTWIKSWIQMQNSWVGVNIIEVDIYKSNAEGRQKFATNCIFWITRIGKIARVTNRCLCVTFRCDRVRRFLRVQFVLCSIGFLNNRVCGCGEM